MSLKIAQSMVLNVHLIWFVLCVRAWACVKCVFISVIRMDGVILIGMQKQ